MRRPFVANADSASFRNSASSAARAQKLVKAPGFAVEDIVARFRDYFDQRTEDRNFLLHVVSITERLRLSFWWGQLPRTTPERRRA